MRHVTLTALLTAMLAASTGCSNDTSFKYEDGVCIRVREKNVVGVTYSSTEVQAIQENCQGTER